MTAHPSSAAPVAAHPALAILALAVGGFAIGISEFASMSVLPFFRADFGITEPEAGRAISAYALGVCVGAPTIAVATAKMARRPLLIALMLFYAVANALGGIAPDFSTFTMGRFLSGLPHGAYFGVAMLVAAGIAGPKRRGLAVALILLGLTVATIIGVPLANWVAQGAGWRWTFALAAAAAAACAVMTLIFVPPVKAPEGASPLRELNALKRGQVWLTLGVGAIGFGGLFAVYTYVGSVMIEYAGAPAAALPWMLAVFGVGMALGGIVCGWLADRAMTPAIFGALGISALSCAAYALVAHDVWLTAAAVFCIGLGGGLSPLLQTRLMNVAEDAQTLAAALNHTAFNVANALGPWAAGMALAAGWGWTSVGWVGMGLALAGIAMMILTLALERLHHGGGGQAIPAA